MNEVSKCAKINCSSFDNLYFHLEDLHVEIWVLKATVQKLSMSSIIAGRQSTSAKVSLSQHFLGGVNTCSAVNRVKH